jgi:hypothetical protein
MNKNRFLKALMLGFVMAITVGFLAKGVTAQVLNQQIQMSSSLAQPIPGPIFRDDGPIDLDEVSAVLVDNFEYWGNPRNMGWQPQEPAYPIWGAGLGYGQLQNVLDFEEGSKVLDVYRPTSVFLLDPRTGLATYTISKATRFIDNEDPDDAAPIWGDFCEFSCKIRHPLSVEAWDTFSIVISVEVMNTKDYDPENSETVEDIITDIPVNIVLRPIENSNAHETLADSVDEQTMDDADESYVIEAALGRQFQDGSWHYVVANLEEIVKAADPDCTLVDFLTLNHVTDGDEDHTTRTAINAVTIMGNQYRIDDIMFTQPAKSISGNGVPHLFRIGPIYGQLWIQGQSFWIFAEDGDLGMTLSMNDDDQYQFTNIFAGCEPITFDLACEDGSLVDEGYDEFIFNPDADTEGLVEDIKILEVDDEGDPICDAEITDEDANLTFQFTVGDTLGSCDFLSARPVYCIPNGDGEVDIDEHSDGQFPFSQAQVDSFPPYLLQEDGILVRNVWETREAYDGETEEYEIDSDAYYMRSFSNPMYVLACALFNAGHSSFPNVRVLNPSYGQVPEDLIITCRVTDGIGTDKETFPVSVVNYPVSNFPPMLNDLDDQVFFVQRTPDLDTGMNVYRVMAHDHDPQDMFSLTYHCTLNGLPNYQVGPFQQTVISPTSGIIAFTPYSEGALHAIITVEDPRGMYSIGEITIFCCNKGGWYNHPPIILGDMDSPQTIRAGQLFIANEMDFCDPDGDELYWSCNIGAVGENGLYTFQSQYPGYYLVQITAYDIRGGAATTEFLIHVLPWWAY